MSGLEATFRRKFGRQVRAARTTQGLSQRELAERADVTDKYLSRIEVGAAMPSVFVADCLARALGVGIEVLTGRTTIRATGASALMRRAVRQLRGMDDADLARAVRVLVALAR
jgi:ribosome-binding protein aMBF1 (putative translation factor)